MEDDQNKTLSRLFFSIRANVNETFEVALFFEQIRWEIIFYRKEGKQVS